MRVKQKSATFAAACLASSCLVWGGPASAQTVLTPSGFPASASTAIAGVSAPTMSATGYNTTGMPLSLMSASTSPMMASGFPSVAASPVSWGNGFGTPYSLSSSMGASAYPSYGSMPGFYPQSSAGVSVRAVESYTPEPMKVAVEAQPVSTPVIVAPENYETALSNSEFYGAFKGALVVPHYTIYTHDDLSIGTFEPDESMGFGGSVAVGTRMEMSDTFAFPNIRLEVEGAAYTNELSNGTFFGGGTFTNGATVDYLANATETMVAGFANLKVDLGRVGVRSGLRPYFGGGVGYGLRGTSLRFSNGSSDELRHRMRSYGVFYQGSGGMAFDITRNMSMEAGYKYVRVPKHDAQEFGLAGNTYEIESEGRDLHLFETGFMFRY